MSAADEAVPQTANERFKRRFDRWVWIGVILATLAHLALFLGMPGFEIHDITFRTADLDVVEIPDEIEIPPAPQSIARPATPVMAEAGVETDLTIAPTTFESNPVETLPPPPDSRGEEGLAAAPTFTPMTVRPRLMNGDEIVRVLRDHYPRLLRNAGIGGTVQVWFFIDETGCVVRTLIHESSGYDAFDHAALRVADRMEFSPAYNRDQRVPVWVSLPVRFEVVQGG